MRKGLRGLTSAALIASTIATFGCTDSSSGGGGGSGGTSGGGGAPSGGSSSTGGSSGTTDPTDCPEGTPCGGDLVGTWNVTSSCLALSGDMDGSMGSLGCRTIPVTGSVETSGTWTASANGTYTDATTTTGWMTFSLDDSCLTVSSVQVECSRISAAFTPLGWNAECSTDASGQCNCSATADLSGGLGVVSPWAYESGSYKTSGSALNIEDQVDYAYCVSGNTLTLAPQPKFLPVTGTIVLQKNGTSPGSGGASSTGGADGSGGATTAAGGSGGATTAAGGSGGATTAAGGSGGATTAAGGSGGATTAAGGSGGTSGRGGTGGRGGTSGRGGTGGSGGATTAVGGTSGSGGSGGSGGTTNPGSGPCDIYAAADVKCVAAHSTVRALYGSYDGSLYQIKRADGTTTDVGVLSPGGVADSSTQDTFCSGSATCVITRVYDQSGNGNFVEAETADSTVGGNPGQSASNAMQEQLTLGGHKVYSLYLKTAQAYWRDGSKSGMPTGSAPQGIYMVTSGEHYGSGCCFDYGNGPTSRTMSGGGTMDAVNFSSCTIWGTGAGSGPWVMADLEGGLYAQGGGGKNNSVLSMTNKYVTAMEKNNGTSEFALKGADATTGNLTTFYKGNLPPGYSPMKKEGAIILGSGGDCCYSNTTMSQGTFYEGAIVAGYPSDTTDDAVQTNIVGAAYGK